MNRKEYLKEAAKKALDQSLSIIAVDADKSAIFKWNAYQDDIITYSEICRQLDHERANGFAVICGAVSGNLEVIDVDLQNDVSGDLWQRFAASIDPAVFARLYIVRSKSGGYHLYYRCEVIGKNTKLAMRPATPEELKETPHVKQLVLIETRGEGGYVVAPPADGYRIEQENEIPVISLDEREAVLEAARSFHEVHTEERPRYESSGTTSYAVSPFDDFNNRGDIVSMLLKHGWTVVNGGGADKVQLLRPGNSKAKTSGNWHKEKNLFYVWSSSTQFEPGKAYSPVAVYAMLEHNGDYSAASIQLSKDGYGEKSTRETERKASEGTLEFPGKFWIPKEKKTDRLKISIHALVTYLHEKGGFTCYKFNETSENIIVQIVKGIVKEVEMYDIKQFLKNEIMVTIKKDEFDNTSKVEIIETIYKEYLKFLNEGFMDFLTAQPLDFLKDTKTHAYFPFINGVVEVTAAGVRLKKYKELAEEKKVIWASQMINRNIELPSEKEVRETGGIPDFDRIDYARFIGKVAGNDDPAKFKYFVSVLGYLLHKYKDPKNAFAVILAEEAENDSNGGGTGKGLFVKGIKELIPTEVFDGKQFNAAKSFALQRVSYDTKIIAIEDARRGFSFESLYSWITEGVPVEKKNQKEFFIPFADAPKITISTNYTISDEGNHAKRRQKVLEFSNYFSPSHTPFDEFGGMMFEDWDVHQWKRFFNFMFFACWQYLLTGIVQADQSEGNKLKNIKLKYSEDLLIYFNGHVEVQKGYDSVKAMYEDFLETYGISSKDYDKNKFSKGVKYIADTLGYIIEEKVIKIADKSQRALRITKKETAQAK